MADFKILGDADAVPTNELGQMTQGLGYPLRSVDEDSGSAVQIGDPIANEIVVSSSSYVDQVPSGTGIGNQIQISFGGAQPNLDANGTFTAPDTGQYIITTLINTERTTSPQTVILWFYLTVNGAQVGSSQAIKLRSRQAVPFVFTVIELFDQNDEVKFYLVRDPVRNDGQLTSTDGSALGINSSPSAFLEIRQQVIA